MQCALVIYTEPGYDDGLSDGTVRRCLPSTRRCSTTGASRPRDCCLGDQCACGRCRWRDADDRRSRSRTPRKCSAGSAYANPHEAIEPASLIPAVRLGGTVEVRPVVQR